MRTWRAVLLYLFVAAAALSALAAWDSAVQESPARAVFWALGIAAALGIGFRLEPSLASIEVKRRRLLAGFLGTFQMSVLGLAIVLAAVRPSPELLSFITSFVSGYLLLVLGLVGLSPHPRAALAHGLALATLACLRGGGIGAFGAVSAFVLGALFIGVDHHARILTAYRIDLDLHAERSMGRALAMVSPVAFLFVLLLSFAPLETPMGRSFEAVRRTEVRLNREAFRSIVVAGVGGTVAVYVMGRFFNRKKRANQRTLEVSEPFRGQPEKMVEPAPPSLPRRAGGRRGRIIHAYLTLLEGLAQKQFPREPHETPSEFAAAVGEPRRPLETLTALFTAARWGPTEPRDEDVWMAESASREIATAISRRPPRRKAADLREVR